MVRRTYAALHWAWKFVNYNFSTANFHFMGVGTRNYKWELAKFQPYGVSENERKWQRSTSWQYYYIIVLMYLWLKTV